MGTYSLSSSKAIALFVVTVLGTMPCKGQSPDPERFVVWVRQDASAAVQSLATREALIAAAGMGGVVLLMHSRDEIVTERINEFAATAPAMPRRILNEVGNVKLIRPLALAFFLGTLVSGDEYLQDAAFTSVEAIVFANLLASTLKGVVGRARPWQGKGASSFGFFSGNTSFPSGHATTVFALTTPWLVYYRSAPTVLLFVLGMGTAVARMADNVHWLSDVVVGSAIGAGTGYLLSVRHRRGISLTPIVGTGIAGLQLNWTLGKR